MRTLIARFNALYGGNPLHLLGSIAARALAGYVVNVPGPQALWNTRVWWQSIAVWFVAAVIAHDLILFPLYALADRSVTGALAAVRGRRTRRCVGLPHVSPLNYLRVPTLATGLSLLLFFPESSNRDRPATSRPPGRTNNLSSGGGCCSSATSTVSAHWPMPPDSAASRAAETGTMIRGPSLRGSRVRSHRARRAPTCPTGHASRRAATARHRGTPWARWALPIV